MHDLAELERRISTALARIAAGIEVLPPPAAPPPAPPPAAPTPTAPAGDTDPATRAALDEAARLRAELEVQRQANATLRADLAAARAAPPVEAGEAALRARIDQMTRQLDVQGLEMHRMRKMIVQLRENLRGMRRAQAANLTDPEQINRAMLAELEAMRVTRLSEVAELDEILTELDPLIREEAPDA